MVHFCNMQMYANSTAVVMPVRLDLFSVQCLGRHTLLWGGGANVSAAIRWFYLLFSLELIPHVLPLITQQVQTDDLNGQVL